MVNNTTKHLCAWLGLFVLAVAVTAQGGDAPRPCNRLATCTNEENVVWATDGRRNCTTWRNACQLGNENCRRQNRYETLLYPIEREQCQRWCRLCTLQYNPVCAEYNGNRRTFGNSCLLGNHICTTGETYNLIGQGAC
ncbi:U-Kazal-Dg21.2-like [Eurosta solidaginis]|uniref:U-Kazal-Dg21.2-like n=1 Tax=Eurosta solidaginis TaxID=178769 RepID=UPI003530EE77